MKKICYFISAAILLSFMGCGHQPMTKKLADNFISAAILLSFMGCGHQPMTKKLADIDSLIIKERYDSACAILNSLNKRQ